MIAVIFETYPKSDQYDEYLNIAADLKPMLEKIDGFISVERFSSMSIEGKILSLSFFRDEEAVMAWRNLEAHRSAQAKGRIDIFKDYRIRIAEVMRDYKMNERDQAPIDSNACHLGDENG